MASPGFLETAQARDTVLVRQKRGVVNMKLEAIWLAIRILIIVGTLAGLYYLPLERKRVFILSMLATLVFSCGAYLLLAEFNKSLGWSVILVGPFLNGMLFVFLYALLNREVDPASGVTTARQLPDFARLAVLLPTILVCIEIAVLFALLLEGIICILMAAPFFYVCTLMGSMVAYAILKGLKAKPGRNMMLSVIALGLTPLLTQPAENQLLVESLKTKVTTEIIINAPPDKVFEYVKAFPPIPADYPVRHAEESLFLLGLPAPKQSTIDCDGPGCMRHCIFNQNTQFEEQVTIYKPGKELIFTVTSVVGPQNPITGVDIHVMPGGMYFDNHQGQFLLDEIAPGKTRVRGTTWYTLQSSLNWYAKPWADLMLHTIHRRVLEHVKTLAEADTGFI